MLSVWELLFLDRWFAGRARLVPDRREQPAGMGECVAFRTIRYRSRLQSRCN
jgi:hypothetical protein